MRCEQFRASMEDYQDGELSGVRAAEMADHAGVCAECKRELDLLKREGRIFTEYADKVADQIALSPDLWRQALTRAAADAEETGRSPRSYASGSWWSFLIPSSPWARQAVAAALLVAISVAGTLLVVDRYRGEDRPASHQEANTAVGEDKSLDAALRSIQKAEQEYLKAIRDLSAIVEKQKSTLDPGIVAEMQTNLKIIDDHIAATRKAYYSHPDDAELAIYMLTAYSRKVELLQELAAS